MKRFALAALCAAAVGCATSAQVTRGAGATISQAQAAPATGGKYRIAVGAIIDKTAPDSETSLTRQLQRLNALGRGPEQLQSGGVLGGIRDLLITELFGSDRFIVLERDSLDAVLTEQEFSHSARAGDATRIPLGRLEGAELLVVGALTAFDAGVDGGAIPLPIPLGRSGDFTVLNLSFKRGYAAMDLRVIDVKSGRVLSSVAVAGRNGSFGASLSGFFGSHTGYVQLPGLLSYFQNTPVEEALQKMVTASVDEIARSVPLVH